MQLSPQAAEETAARTGDYADAEVSTLWVVQEPSRIGAGHAGVPHLVVDAHDQVAKPLLRMRTSTGSVWDGRRHRRLTTVSWRQVDHPADLDATVSAIFDGRVVWSEAAPGWVPTKELEPFERAAAAEAAARAGAKQELHALRDSERRRADDELAVHAEGDPIGYATALKVAERLAAAGHGNPRVTRGSAVIAHAWRVEAGQARVNVDPDPIHFGRVYRNRIDRRRYTVRTNVEKLPTVVSAERYSELEGELRDLHHVSTWMPEPAVLPSPDGKPVRGDHLDAARQVLLQAYRAFRPPLEQAAWSAEEHAWVWALPDGATVALAGATSEHGRQTQIGSHRLVIHLNREVLRRDGGRRIIWRNLTAAHLTGRVLPGNRPDTDLTR